MDQPAFDTAAVFDEDYLYFYAELLTESRSDTEADLLWRLLDLESGMQVLDLACGHGRISNRLAERGCRITGLDLTPLFLELARRDAATRQVNVDYVQGDMRRLPWSDRFDRVVCWFTSFGYFDDAGNRKVLAQAARALRPGGRLAVELNHRDWLLGHFHPAIVAEHDGDLLIDQHRIEPLTGRAVTERTIVRGGRVRRAPYSVRLFTFTELRDWLLEAGFASVDGYGEDGEPLSMDHRRMIVVAHR